MKNYFYFPVVFIVLFFTNACNTTAPKQQFMERQRDEQVIDSIKKISDTFYTRKYGRSDFVTAEYIVVKNDSTLAQVMRDSTKKLRQLIITGKNIKIYAGQYYANGQIMAIAKYNAKGNMEGASTSYYNNGFVMAEGHYINGIKVGKWKEYNSANELTETVFDSAGVITKQP